MHVCFGRTNPIFPNEFNDSRKPGGHPVHRQEPWWTRCSIAVLWPLTSAGSTKVGGTDLRALIWTIVPVVAAFIAAPAMAQTDDLPRRIAAPWCSIWRVSAGKARWPCGAGKMDLPWTLSGREASIGRGRRRQAAQPTTTPRCCHVQRPHVRKRRHPLKRTYRPRIDAWYLFGRPT
jgi:hypothetical protein